MKRTALRALAVLLLLGAVVLALAPWLASLGEKPTTGSWTEEQLSAWLSSSRAALVLLLAFKFGPPLIGIAFLVRELLLAERRRAGLLPALDGLGPTAVAGWQEALGLGLAFPIGIQLCGAALLGRERLQGPNALEYRIALTAASFLPTTMLVLLRRRRLGWGRLPAVSAGLGDGLRFASIALLLVTPLQFAWVLALRARGLATPVQELVQQFAEPLNPAQPWVIAGFGVLVAPLTEEAVFRGLLYPALRARAPGGPLGAAVLVALLFGAVHGSLMAFLPLFLLALVLCWVMERTNSLVACVTVHAVHNALSLAPMLVRHMEGGRP